MANRSIVHSCACAFMLLVSVGASSSFAQESPSENKKNPFYFDLNTATQDKVFDVQVDMLGIQYVDNYGTWKEVLLKIYNWKREVVVSVTLQKVYGINHFNIPLHALYSSWEINKIYICELKDESGRKYELPIRIIPPPDKNDPVKAVWPELGQAWPCLVPLECFL